MTAITNQTNAFLLMSVDKFQKETGREMEDILKNYGTIRDRLRVAYWEAWRCFYGNRADLKFFDFSFGREDGIVFEDETGLQTEVDNPQFHAYAISFYKRLANQDEKGEIAQLIPQNVMAIVMTLGLLPEMVSTEQSDKLEELLRQEYIEGHNDGVSSTADY